MTTITAMQAMEALDELESSARGDEPFNNLAAPVVRAFIESAMAAPEEGPSATSITLAATILSDCGISTDYVSLHERVAARITKYADELLATWKRLQAPATAPSHTEAEVQELLHDDREMTEERFEISVRRILGVPAP